MSADELKGLLGRLQGAKEPFAAKPRTHAPLKARAERACKKLPPLF
jgi:hypothetical protein